MTIDTAAPSLPIPSLIGIDAWQPPQPVILIADAADAEPIAENYPTAAVIALPSDPAEQAMLAHLEAWGAFLPLMGADVTLWPVSALQVAYFAALTPILRDAGVRTLRLAVPHENDWARYSRLKVVWKNKPLHTGPAVGALLTLQASRCPQTPEPPPAPSGSTATTRPAEEVMRMPVAPAGASSTVTDRDAAA